MVGRSTEVTELVNISNEASSGRSHGHRAQETLSKVGMSVWLPTYSRTKGSGWDSWSVCQSARWMIVAGTSTSSVHLGNRSWGLYIDASEVRKGGRFQKDQNKNLKKHSQAWVGPPAFLILGLFTYLSVQFSRMMGIEGGIHGEVLAQHTQRQVWPTASQTDKQTSHTYMWHWYILHT